MFFGINFDGQAEYLKSQTALAQGNGICVRNSFQNNSNPRFWFDQLRRHSSQLQKLDRDPAPQTHRHQPRHRFKLDFSFSSEKERTEPHPQAEGERKENVKGMSHLISLTPRWKTSVASRIYIFLQLLSLPH